MGVSTKDVKLVCFTATVTFLCIALLSVTYMHFLSPRATVSAHSPIIDLWNAFFNSAYSTMYAADRLLISRMSIICGAIAGAALIGLRPQQAWNACIAFWTAPTHPINLAIFRIVFFLMLLSMFDFSSTVWFSALPSILIDPPRGLAWVVPHLPINPTLTAILGVVFMIGCCAAMIGVFTRVSTGLVLVTGAYVMTIPQLYGKVMHEHHLIWFMAILAVSSCGDALSIDALVRSGHRADQGQLEPPGPALIYTLPLRFVWFLIGLIYLFPGLRKAWNGGIDWIITDNLRYMMYNKWIEFGQWTPVFRIDHYPLLYKSLAAGTILFEIGFIFLIFFRRFRVPLALGGLAFHTGVETFMRISFRSLQGCYVAFFDWHAIFHCAGTWLYRVPLDVLYDGTCPGCRRTIAALRVLDMFGRITYIDAWDERERATSALTDGEPGRLMQHIHTVEGSRRGMGFAAYRTIATRVPLFWIVLPCLYLGRVPRMGHTSDRRVTDRQALSETGSALAPVPRSSQRWVRVCIVVGTVLIAGHVLAGVKGAVTTWPIASYPPFDRLARAAQVRSLEIKPLLASGEVVSLRILTPHRHMATFQWLGMVDHVIDTWQEHQRPEVFLALWKLVAQANPELQQVREVEFYEVTLPTEPDRQPTYPTERRLLHKVIVLPQPGSPVQKP